MESTYASALVNRVASGQDEAHAVKSLVANLKATGRMKLLPHILTELKQLRARSAKRGARVEVASEHEKAYALKEAAALGIVAEHATVNHALIRGWRAQKDGTLIDRSAKRMLIDIYQNVVSGT
jgi:hypothetical protein